MFTEISFEKDAFSSPDFNVLNIKYSKNDSNLEFLKNFLATNLNENKYKTYLMPGSAHGAHFKIFFIHEEVTKISGEFKKFCDALVLEWPRLSRFIQIKALDMQTLAMAPSLMLPIGYYSQHFFPTYCSEKMKCEDPVTGEVFILDYQSIGDPVVREKVDSCVRALHT